jgi:CBS-domain-containing membrane protein
MATPDASEPVGTAPRLMPYLRKMRGTTRGSPPRVSDAELVWSWVGSFLGIGAVALVSHVLAPVLDQGLMIGSLGASAVLVFGAPRSPLAQPRNLMGGHVLSALVGVVCFHVLGDSGLAAALAVATAIALMHLTKTLHPPGGATALIAVIGSAQIHELGFLYALAPVGAGALVLLIVGLLVNNLAPDRRYPEGWW